MPRFATIGTFAGVYGAQDAAGPGVIDETANYAGAVMLFQQTAAPTGWVKSTANDDALLTVTTGTLSTGGVSGVSALLNTTRTVSGAVTFTGMTIGTTAITEAMTPVHTHTYAGYNFISTMQAGPTAIKRPPETGPIGATPNFSGAAYTGPTSHTHPNFGPTTSPATYFNTNFNIKYVDVIVATKS